MRCMLQLIRGWIDLQLRLHQAWCSRLYYCIDQLSHHKPDPSMIIDRLPALAATFPCGCCVTTPCPIGQYPDCDTSNQTHRLASDNLRET